MTKIEIENLSPGQIELINSAIAARENAYAPYSKFKVGAALRDSQDCIHTGCNIESVDFTLTSHAEMVAVDSMVKSGNRQMVEIAVVVQSNNLPVPCGLCRQKMLEFSAKNVSIICVNIDDCSDIAEVYVSTLNTMLPYPFAKFEANK